MHKGAREGGPASNTRNCKDKVSDNGSEVTPKKKNSTKPRQSTPTRTPKSKEPNIESPRRARSLLNVKPVVGKGSIRGFLSPNQPQSRNPERTIPQVSSVPEVSPSLLRPSAAERTTDANNGTTAEGDVSAISASFYSVSSIDSVNSANTSNRKVSTGSIESIEQITDGEDAKENNDATFELESTLSWQEIGVKNNKAPESATMAEQPVKLTPTHETAAEKLANKGSVTQELIMQTSERNASVSHKDERPSTNVNEAHANKSRESTADVLQEFGIDSQTDMESISNKTVVGMFLKLMIEMRGIKEELKNGKQHEETRHEVVTRKQEKLEEEIKEVRTELSAYKTKCNKLTNAMLNQKQHLVEMENRMERLEQTQMQPNLVFYSFLRKGRNFEETGISVSRSFRFVSLFYQSQRRGF